MFEEPLNPLSFRVVFAPIEMGPYNRHTGYTHSPSAFILANRHCCGFGEDRAIALRGDFENFIVHELTHSRQKILLGTHHLKNARGSIATQDGTTQ